MGPSRRGPTEVGVIAPRLTARQILDRSISEQHWQADIVEMAERLGWAIMHVNRSRVGEGQNLTVTGYDGKGWPDLALFRPPRSVAIEVKTELGRVTPEQRGWLALLAACGWSTMVARPSDRDRVLALLT